MKEFTLGRDKRNWIEEQEALQFWWSVIRNPRRMSALAPSSAALAQLITSQISLEHAPVIELGPGTGVFTRKLLERGVPESKLILIEASGNFIPRLSREFPKADIYHMDAGKLHQLDVLSSSKAGAVISGLPLLSMPNSLVYKIMKAVFENLRPDGAMYQFTYGLRSPIVSVIQKRLNLQVQPIGFTAANLPPARVYRIGRG